MRSPILSRSVSKSLEGMPAVSQLHTLRRYHNFRFRFHRVSPVFYRMLPYGGTLGRYPIPSRKWHSFFLLAYIAYLCYIVTGNIERPRGGHPMSDGPVLRSLISNRQCISCKQQMSLNRTALRCEECNNKIAAQNTLIREYRRKNKLCMYCGDKRSFGAQHCDKCIHKIREKVKKHEYSQTTQGKCPRCSSGEIMETLKNNAISHRLCEKCYFKKAALANLGSKTKWEIAKNLLISQNYLCAYTGELLVLGINDAMDHKMPISKFPELKHDPSNVHWVDRRINQLKWSRTDEEFRSLIIKIYNHITSTAQPYKESSWS